MYSRIVFLQGEEADEPLRILDESGQDAAIEYLAGWDYGDDDDTHDEAASGDDDDVYETSPIGPLGDRYRLSYNTRLGYIGLERVV